ATFTGLCAALSFRTNPPTKPITMVDEPSFPGFSPTRVSAPVSPFRPGLWRADRSSRAPVPSLPDDTRLADLAPQPAMPAKSKQPTKKGVRLTTRLPRVLERRLLDSTDPLSRVPSRSSIRSRLRSDAVVRIEPIKLGVAVQQCQVGITPRPH